MVEITCLWCEAAVAIDAHSFEHEQTCPECLSTWLFEDDAASELALAA